MSARGVHGQAGYTWTKECRQCGHEFETDSPRTIYCQRRPCRAVRTQRAKARQRRYMRAIWEILSPLRKAISTDGEQARQWAPLLADVVERALKIGPVDRKAVQAAVVRAGRATGTEGTRDAAVGLAAAAIGWAAAIPRTTVQEPERAERAA